LAAVVEGGSSTGSSRCVACSARTSRSRSARRERGCGALLLLLSVSLHLLRPLLPGLLAHGGRGRQIQGSPASRSLPYRVGGGVCCGQTLLPNNVAKDISLKVYIKRRQLQRPSFSLGGLRNSSNDRTNRRQPRLLLEATFVRIRSLRPSFSWEDVLRWEMTHDTHRGAQVRVLRLTLSHFRSARRGSTRIYFCFRNAAAARAAERAHVINIDSDNDYSQRRLRLSSTSHTRALQKPATHTANTH
jgi:hypothetical protein